MTIRTAVPLALMAGLALTACSGPDKLYTAPDLPVSGGQVSSAYRTVAVQEVSLPDYASADEMATRQPDGSVMAAKHSLWADQPTRAVTLELARQLGVITGAQVAATPWPFYDQPAARVDVRVEQMLAEDDGTFHLSGSYYVSPEAGRGRAGTFDLHVPMQAKGGPTEIAQARSEAILQLSRAIAQHGLH